MSMYVITHKHFNYKKLPLDYVPILVGATINDNPDRFIADNTYDNISEKNPFYSELTGLYWIWKNTSCGKVGISHYRRYFSSYSNYEKLYEVRLLKRLQPVSVKKLNMYLNDYDWIISTPKTVGEISLMEQFTECHHKKDIDITRDVIKRKHPEYLDDFDTVMSNNAASFYNMFYTSRRELDAYCTWLFNILFEVEKLTDVSNYDTYQKRLYGFLSERLFNIWIHHRQARVKYLAEYNSEEISRRMAFTELSIHFIKKRPILYSFCKHFKNKMLT